MIFNIISDWMILAISIFQTTVLTIVITKITANDDQRFQITQLVQRVRNAILRAFNLAIIIGSVVQFAWFPMSKFSVLTLILGLMNGLLTLLMSRILWVEDQIAIMAKLSLRELGVHEETQRQIEGLTDIHRASADVLQQLTTVAQVHSEKLVELPKPRRKKP